jgi:hypothetical protein
MTENFGTVFYEVISGSRAYGFANENSDLDYRGIFFPNLDSIYGLETFKDPQESKDPDRVLYSFKKFMTLAIANNPNVLELLWIDDPRLLVTNHAYVYFIKNIRKSFLSKRIFKTYLGYATAQMHKIKNDGNCSPEMNSRRMEDIKKNGYDTKAASHVFRLLYQGIELALYKNINVPLPDHEAELCREIRQGKMRFNDFISNVESLTRTFRHYESLTDLPDEPDTEVINDLMIEINKTFYR